jgi:energy-coupling factor transporter ATP-binding protein EcfA2
MVENSESAPVTRAPFPESAINTDDKSVAEFKKVRLRPNQVSDKFASKEPTKPFLLFVAGPSGSGKSTLVEVLKRKSYFPANTVFLDSDDFFNFIPKSEQDAQVHPEKYAPYADMYYTMREEIVKQAIAEGRPVVIENHMTNLDANRSLIKAAKAAGFETMAIGVHTLPKDYLHLWQHMSDDQVPESKTLSAFKVNETFAQHWPQIAADLDYAALYTSHVSRRSEVGYIRNNPGALIELTAEYEGAKDNPVCYVH